VFPEFPDSHLQRRVYTYRWDDFLVRIEKYTDVILVDDVRIVRGGLLALQDRDSGDNVLREYLWGANLGGGIGGLLNLRQNGVDYAYLYDGKGNVGAVLDNTQAVVASYRYNAFGKLVARSGTLEQPFQFSTKRYDEGTGLNYYGYRFYSPAIERWMNRDPLGEAGGINLYGFVQNDPVNFIDPSGLDAIVTLYAGQNGNPFNHIGIGTTTGNNAGQTFGAGPNHGAGIGLISPVPGHVGPDNGTPIGTVTIPTTPQQDAAINAYNQAAASSPFQYDLTDNSCVDHVRGGLNAGGIDVQNLGQNTTLPNTLFESLQNGHPNTPTDLLQNVYP